MTKRAIAAASALLIASAGVASAQNAALGYVPPKVIKLGTATENPLGGPGSVIVKVFVKKDGSAQVSGVLKSTNPADNAIALEIARKSTYKPASRGGIPEDAYKDFTLTFSSTGANVTGEPSESGVASIEASLRAGNYKTAREQATAYLEAHPGDQAASAALGAADEFLGDSAGAVAAFERAGSLPDRYVPLASQAYIANSASLTSEKKYDAAVASAKRAVALSASVSAYNALGIAELSAGDSASAVKDLSQASALAGADQKIPPAVHATILANLAAAYAGAGQLDKATQAAADAQRLDPNSRAGEAVGQRLVANASALLAQKKYVEAGATYEQAAPFFKNDAATLYAQAAFSYLNAQPRDTAKAMDASQKAIAADPNSAIANRALGLSLAVSGKQQEGKTTLSKALSLAKSANQTELADAIERDLKQFGSP